MSGNGCADGTGRRSADNQGSRAAATCQRCQLPVHALRLSDALATHQRSATDMACIETPAPTAPAWHRTAMAPVRGVRAAAFATAVLAAALALSLVWALSTRAEKE